MNLDETWQVGLRPEKTRPCTFPTKSHNGFRRQREKWVEEALFFCDVNHALLLPLFLDRHIVSYSRKVSIKGSNFPKNPLFVVPCL